MSRDLVAISPAPPAMQHVTLRATACNGRSQTLRHLQAALRLCRGFLLQENHPATHNHASLKFEVPRHSIFDLYSGLLAADLDLSRDSHQRLTSLCNLRRYHPLRGGNVCLTLELSFPDEIDLTEPWAALGFA